MWGVANEDREEGPVLGGQRCRSGLASIIGRARVWVIPLSVPPSSLGLLGLWLPFPPFSLLTTYGRFHTSWIWLRTAPGSAQLSRLYSHSDHQVTSVFCVYTSRSSRIVLCLYCQGFFCHPMLGPWLQMTGQSLWQQQAVALASQCFYYCKWT